MGDRICIMNRGEVVQIGAAAGGLSAPADTFVARFLGNPPMNLLAARLDAEGGPAVVRIGDLAIALPGGPSPALARHRGAAVTLGIRPEDLYEVAPPALRDRCVALPVRVVAVEPLGAETLLVLGFGSEELNARIGRDTGLRRRRRPSRSMPAPSTCSIPPPARRSTARAEGDARRAIRRLPRAHHRSRSLSLRRWAGLPAAAARGRHSSGVCRGARPARRAPRAPGPAERLRVRQRRHARRHGASSGPLQGHRRGRLRRLRTQPRGAGRGRRRRRAVQPGELRSRRAHAAGATGFWRG